MSHHHLYDNTAHQRRQALKSHNYSSESALAIAQMPLRRLPRDVRAKPVTFPLKPNTHRRRRRDETVVLRRVGIGGLLEINYYEYYLYYEFATSSRRLPTDSVT